VLFLMVIIAFITDRMIAPRLGAYNLRTAVSC
jgi:p-aminobenzoyl-glutamate transporter AbgT